MKSLRVQPLMLLLAALFAAAAALPFAATAHTRRDFYFFDVELTSTRPGQTQLFFDMGAGFNEPDSSRQPLRAEPQPVRYRFMMPTGVLRGLRFDPIDREGEVRLAAARIVDAGGAVIRSFAPGDFRPAQQVANLDAEGGTVVMRTVPDAGDPILELTLGEPLALPYGFAQMSRVMAWPLGAVFGLSLAVMVLLSGEGAGRLLARASALAARRPVMAIALCAALGVAIQCHPVVFFGKSFVSPDNAGYLLYDRFPTLPGYETTELEDAKNADVGAMLYQHLHYPVIERRALAAGELPLWSRHNLGGVPLLGQGQSMFGELLNFLPIAADGAAWSWDAKFVIARWLYCFGMGVAGLLLTRRLGPALLLASIAGFAGFFAYRINHPAQFSLCFSIWILVAWLMMRDATDWRRLGWAAGLWVLANWEVMTSGTVKEAYMLILGVNLAGLLLLVFGVRPAQGLYLRLAAASAAGLAFLMLSAPLWLVFLDTLALSRTNYDAPGVIQLPFRFFLGLFEDLFARQGHTGETHRLPSANVAVLAAVAWACVHAHRVFRDRAALALGVAAIPPLMIVFGLIPGSWLVRVPFIANIHHVDNTFACVAVVILTALAAFGFRDLMARLREPGAWRGLLLTGIVLSGLVGLYAWTNADLTWSPFFRALVIGQGITLVAGAAALVSGHRQGKAGLALAGAFVALSLLLWRHGQYLHTPFDAYVFNPKVRADLRAPSPAVQAVNGLLSEPSRPAGLGLNLFSGYHQMLGWEGIYGVDALRSQRFDDLAIAGGARKVRWWEHQGWQTESIAEIQPLQDMLNVRYYLDRSGGNAGGLPGLRHVASLDLDIYESPTAWPRAFFTGRILTHRSLTDFVAQLRGADRRPFASVAADDAEAAVETRRLRPDPAAETYRAARDYALTPNTTAFTVEAPGPGLIVLTETWYPGEFQVTVNGIASPYIRVNHAFKAVAVPAAGTYRVHFAYRPSRLHLALALSGGGCVLLGCGIGAILWAGRRKQTRELLRA